MIRGVGSVAVDNRIRKEEDGMERILPGEVAWYVTGRFYAPADAESAFDASCGSKMKSGSVP